MGKVKLTFMTGISEIDSHRELFSQSEWDSLMSHFRSLSQEDFMAIAISEIDSKMTEEIKGVEVIDILDFFEVTEEGKKKKKKHDK